MYDLMIGVYNSDNQLQKYIKKNYQEISILNNIFFQFFSITWEDIINKRVDIATVENIFIDFLTNINSILAKEQILILTQNNFTIQRLIDEITNLIIFLKLSQIKDNKTLIYKSDAPIKLVS